MRIGVMKHFWAALAFTLLIVSSAAAQDRVARRLLLVVAPDDSTTLAANDLFLLSRSVQMELQRATKEINVVEAAGSVPDLSEAGLAEAAKSAGADSWLSVIAGGGWSTLKLAVRSFDLISNAMVLDTTVTREGWQSPLDLSLESWDDIAQPIAGHYHMVEAAVAPQGPRAALLTIKALPGTKISGLGPKPLVVDASGSLAQEMPVSRQYDIRASLIGHLPEHRQIYLEADRAVDFDQKPESRWTLDMSLQDRAYPGFSIAWSPRLGHFSFKLGITTYLVGLAFNSTGVFSSAPLSEAELQATAYLFPETGFFRLYTAQTFFLRVDHAIGTTPSLDSLSLGGMKGIIGAELLGSARGNWFFEYAPTVYFTHVPNMLQAALSSGSPPPGWLFFPSSAVNLLSFRAGYRWQL